MRIKLEIDIWLKIKCFEKGLMLSSKMFGEPMACVWLSKSMVRNEKKYLIELHGTGIIRKEDNWS